MAKASIGKILQANQENKGAALVLQGGNVSEIRDAFTEYQNS